MNTLGRTPMSIISTWKTDLLFSQQHIICKGGIVVKMSAGIAHIE